MNNHDEVAEQQAAIADLYEKCFIEAVQEQAEQKKIKKGGFAQDVWPESSPFVARHRWEKMRFGDRRTGKPTVCSLSDAYRMVKALGLRMPYVALLADFMVEQRLKEMGQAESEEAPTPPPAKRGRKKKEAGESQDGQ